MSDQNQILEIPGLFSNKISRRLIFETEGFTIEKPFSFDSSLFIPAENVSAIRSGKKGIAGLRFFWGQHFIIDLQHHDDNYTRVKFSSYCGLRVQNYEEAWKDALNHLHQFYFASQVSMYKELLYLKQPFELLGVTFNADGISWGNNGIVPWKQITLSNYQNNFVIHHRQNVRLNIGFDFSRDWNATVLQAMLNYVIEKHVKMLSR